MKIIELDQGSPEWLSWRKTVITATDASAIMGNNPWTTPYKCWQRKLGLVEEKKSNDAMERGKKLEPEARDLFIQKFGINMTPRVIESEEFNFLGASLDGLSDCKKYILEIKCGGSGLHNQAKHGIVPDYYLDQIQHQLLVTRCEKAFYYSYNGSEGVYIEVLPDPEWENKFMPKARDFWKGIAFFEPPALKESDYKCMRDNLDWNEYSRLYQETDASLKALEEKKDYLRKKLIELCANQSCVGNGIKIVKSIMRGRVAYDEIPEIKSVDLDKYRKGSTETWKILLDPKS